MNILNISKLSTFIAAAVLATSAACVNAGGKGWAGVQRENLEASTADLEADGEKSGKKDKVRIVCRSERRTGSHLMTRRCFTVKQSKENRTSSQDWVRSLQTRTSVPQTLGD